MNKISTRITWLFLLTFFEILAQKKVYFDENEKISSHKTAKSYILIQPVDSAGNYKIEFYHLNDSIFAQESFKDSDFKIKNGKFLAYHSNGSKALEISFINDTMHGYEQEWSKSGQLLRKTSYVKGKRSADERYEYENGKLIQDFKIEKDRIHGSTRLFHLNGKIAQEYDFIVDSLTNSAENYDTMDIRIIYTGKRKVYYESGAIKKIENLKNSKRQGEAIRYYENGIIQLKRYYKDEKLVKEKCYGKNGKDTICWIVLNGIISHDDLIKSCQIQIPNIQIKNMPTEKTLSIELLVNEKGRALFYSSSTKLSMEYIKEINKILQKLERTSPFTDEDLIPYKGKINFNVTLK